MAFITLGKVDKKLYLIIIITILIAINETIIYEYSKDICGLLIGLESELSCIIVGIIVYFILKAKIKKNEQKRKSVKYIIVLFILTSIKISFEILYYRYINNPKYNYSGIANTINATEILEVSLVTFILLKYKYYIHHIIFMVIFFASGIGNDIILKSYSILEYDYLYIFIIYLINEVILFCYLKYMMDILFYHYNELLILNGIFGLIIKIVIYSGIIIYEHQNDDEKLISSFLNYFEEPNVLRFIFLHCFFLFLENGIYMLLTLLILYYLKPNHKILVDEIHIYPKGMNILLLLLLEKILINIILLFYLFYK